MLEYAEDRDDQGGGPAQTGSVVHAGVAAFHQMKGDSLFNRKKGAWDAIAKAMPTFPLADETEVRLFITPYMDDPRNIDADCVKIEQQVEFTLQPHPTDPTGELIYVNGTLDQIRRESNRARVWDVKTGKKTGWELIHDHAIQIAAYTVGANQLGLKEEIHPGGIIRMGGYRTRDKAQVAPDGVFWDCGFSLAEIPLILETVTLQVAFIRSGHAVFGTGPHCTYCEFGGIVGCLNHYKTNH